MISAFFLLFTYTMTKRKRESKTDDSSKRQRTGSSSNPFLAQSMEQLKSVASRIVEADENGLTVKIPNPITGRDYVIYRNIGSKLRKQLNEALSKNNLQSVKTFSRPKPKGERKAKRQRTESAENVEDASNKRKRDDDSAKQTAKKQKKYKNLPDDVERGSFEAGMSQKDIEKQRKIKKEAEGEAEALREPEPPKKRKRDAEEDTSTSKKQKKYDKKDNLPEDVMTGSFAEGMTAKDIEKRQKQEREAEGEAEALREPEPSKKRKREDDEEPMPTKKARMDEMGAEETKEPQMDEQESKMPETMPKHHDCGDMPSMTVKEKTDDVPMPDAPPSEMPAPSADPVRPEMNMENRESYLSQLKKIQDAERFGVGYIHQEAVATMFGNVEPAVFVRDVSELHPNLMREYPRTRSALNKGIYCMLYLFGAVIGVKKRKSKENAPMNRLIQEYLSLKLLVYGAIMKSRSRVAVALNASALGLNVNNLKALLSNRYVFPQPEVPKKDFSASADVPKTKPKVKMAYGDKAQVYPENVREDDLPHFRQQQFGRRYVGRSRATPARAMRDPTGGLTHKIRYNT